MRVSTRLGPILACIYVLLVALTPPAFRWLADRSCAFTLLAYGPRWALMLPALGLGWWLRRTHWQWMTVLAMAIVVGPVMNFNVPWHGGWAAGGTVNDATGPAQDRVQILTCNIDGGDLHGAAVEQVAARLTTLIAQTHSDVVAFQEWTGDFARVMHFDSEWQIEQHGDVLTASRWPIANVQAWDATKLGAEGNVLQTVICTPAGAMTFCNLHLETPRRGIEPLLHGKGWQPFRDCLTQRQAASDAARSWIGHRSDVVVSGDFNLASDGAVFCHSWGDLSDAFTRVGWGYGFTKRTGFWGVRIDHVLTADRWRVVRCTVCNDVGSDHRPVLSDLLAK